LRRTLEIPSLKTNALKLLIFFSLLFTTPFAISQNITQLRTYPANPTTSDTVYVLADLQFAYNHCVLDNNNHQINGNSIYAYTHHCMGIAAAICNATDTFKLGVLTDGNYSFNLTLAHGGGAVPCSPGWAPSDLDTLNFTVQSTLAIEDVISPSFSVYPNPAQDVIALSDAYHPITTSIKIVSVLGAVVFESYFPKEMIDVSEFAPGVYTMEIYHKTGMVVEKFIKE